MKPFAIALLALSLLPGSPVLGPAVLAHAKDMDGASAAATRLLVRQDGQAFVTEARAVTLPKGSGELALPGLPATIDASTLRLRSKTAPTGLSVRSLAVSDETLNPAALLRRFVGRQVGVVLPDGKSRDGRAQKQALVLSASEPPLLLVDGSVYSGPVEAIIYPELPQGLAARPAAAASVVNAGPTRQNVELSYLARELSWRMDYALTLNKAGDNGVLDGWVVLTNHCGKSFDQAGVELLAGETRSARPVAARAFMAGDMLMKSSAANAEGEAVFEHHVYTLKRPVSLADQQTLQAPLFDSAAIPVSRKLLGRASALTMGRETGPTQEKLDIVLSFRNTKARGLGLALPRGPLRVFEANSDARRLVGETQLDRVPEGASAEVTVGSAFDLNVERVATVMEKTGNSSWRGAWELRITNGKKRAQRIVLQEQIPGKWKVEQASAKWTKPSAGVLEFAIDVPPTGENAPLVLTYTFSTEQ
ncbi:MAG: hypothetical protein AUJ49_02255 [Desulfovibrionaceae bacterium CG1_02_65_16]|nr:MAG: hypothetical protein AUJ49_02255 [Desulfovibrionaceae bacterium CG1_02_65_16]